MESRIPGPSSRVRTASPPPPPPAQRSEMYIDQLAQKVKKQARELTVLQLDLADKDDYIRTCERWIKSADATTKFPLQEGSLCKRALGGESLNRPRTPSQNKLTMSALKVKLQAEVDKNHTHLKHLRELKCALTEEERLRNLAEKKTQRLERQLAEEKERCARHCRRKSKADDDHKDKNAELQTLRRSLESEITCNEEQQALIELLQGSLGGKQVESKVACVKAEPQFEAMQIEVNQLKRKNDALSDSEFELKERLRDTKKQLEDFRMKYSTVANKSKLTKRLQTLEDENNALLDYVKDTLEPLKKQNQSVSNELSSQSTHNAQLSAQLENLSASNLRAEEKIDELTAKLLEKEVERVRLKEERDSAHSKLETVSKDLEAVRKEHASNAAKLKEVASTLEKTAAHLDEKVKRVSELEDMKVSLSCNRRELVTIETERDEAKELLNDAERKGHFLMGEVEDLTTKLDSCSSRLKTVQSERDQAEKKLSIYKSKLAAAEAEAEQLGKEIKPLRLLQQKCNNLENAIEEIDLDGCVEQMVEDSKNVTELNEVLPNCDSLISSIKAYAGRLRREEKNTRGKLQEVEKIYQVEKRMLHDEIHTLRLEIEKQLSDKQTTTQQNEIVAKTSEWSHLKAENVKLQQRLERLKDDYEDLKRSRERDHGGVYSQGVIDKLNAQLQQASGELKRMHKMSQELEKAAALAEQQNQMVTTLEEDLTYVTSEKEKLQDRLSSLLHLCDNTWKDVRIRFSSSEALEAFVPREEEQPHLLCDLIHSILAHEQRGSKQGSTRAAAEGIGSSRNLRLKELERSRSMRHTKPVQVSDEESIYASEESGDDIADVLVLDEDEYARHHRTRSKHFPENGRHSPTRVRVYRDGSVNVSTLLKDRVRRGSSSDLKLSKLAAKLDRIQRVRSGSVSSKESAITQKYKDRLRHAQEQFRRLERRYDR